MPEYSVECGICDAELRAGSLAALEQAEADAGWGMTGYDASSKFPGPSLLCSDCMDAEEEGQSKRNLNLLGVFRLAPLTPRDKP